MTRLQEKVMICLQVPLNASRGHRGNRQSAIRENPDLV
jgi:hypothetical protein